MKERGIFNKYNAFWLATILVIFGLIFGLVAAGVINQVYLTVLMGIGINIILAVSLNLIIGLTGQFSLGHAGFMCIGAYAAGVVMKNVSSSVGGVLLGMLIGILISVLVSLCLWYFAAVFLIWC